MVWASATEAVDFGWIPCRVTPKTIKIDIHSFPAWRSAIKVTVWQTGEQMVAWLEDWKVPSVSPDQGNLVKKM